MAHRDRNLEHRRSAPEVGETQLALQHRDRAGQRGAEFFSGAKLPAMKTYASSASTTLTSPEMICGNRGERI